MHPSLKRHLALRVPFSALILLCGLCLLIGGSNAVNMNAGQVAACLAIAESIPALKTTSYGAWTEANLLNTCNGISTAVGITHCDSNGMPLNLVLYQGYPASLYANSTLPDAISQLTKLNTLYLYGPISGTLPASWAALTSLATLEIESSLMTGSIPPSWSAMTSLTQVYFSFAPSNTQTLVSLPNWFGKRITRLSLANLNIDAFPEGFNASSQLSEVTFDTVTCSNCTIPDSIRNMEMLNRLYIIGSYSDSVVDFGGPSAFLPSDFSATTMRYLTIKNVNIGGLLPTVYPNTKMQVLDLENLPNLSGTLPQALFDIPTFYYASVVNVPGIYGNLPGPTNASASIFQTIRFSGVSLNGTISANVAVLPALLTLTLSNLTQLKGPLPVPSSTSSSFPCILTDVIIKDNPLFGGSVPSAFTSYCADLVSINLDNNGFTGTLPSALSSFASLSLRSLSISNNPTSGTIPNIAFSSSLTQGLVNISLSNAGLSGSIPLSLSNSLASNVRFGIFNFANNSLNLCANANTTGQATMISHFTSTTTCILAAHPSSSCSGNWPEICFGPAEPSAPIDSGEIPSAPSMSPQNAEPTQATPSPSIGPSDGGSPTDSDPVEPHNGADSHFHQNALFAPVLATLALASVLILL